MRVPGQKFFVPASVNSAFSLLESYKEARSYKRSTHVNRLFEKNPPLGGFFRD